MREKASGALIAYSHYMTPNPAGDKPPHTMLLKVKRRHQR
jgi:hypothetical protein